MKNQSANPTVQTVKGIASRYHKDKVVVFHFKGSEYGYVSYGRTPELCADARVFANRIADMIEEGLVTTGAL